MENGWRPSAGNWGGAVGDGRGWREGMTGCILIVGDNGPEGVFEMGLFWQDVKVGNPAGGDFAEIRALVDTGAGDSVFPASFLAGLHLQPITSYTYVLADGSEVELPFGQASIEIKGEIRYCPVVFGPGNVALLGATTLEIFKLMPDLNTQALWPVSHSALGGGVPPWPVVGG